VNAREAARAIQLEAATPDWSVVLQAAAGSGKTTALVSRFLRLCLEDTLARAHPGTILAVTFTRKAAVEIQDRLLRRARELALADPVERAALLRELFGERKGREPEAQELTAAAGLYEQLLADTGGLNLGTIHSFCQLVLSRFAAEAGLDPGFGVLDDPGELRDEAFDTLVGEIARDPELAAAARRLGPEPDSLRRTLQACLDENMRLERWLRIVAPNQGFDPLQPSPPRLASLPLLEADLRRRLFPDVPDADDDFSGTLAGRLARELSVLARTLPKVVSAAFGDDLPEVPNRDLAAMVGTAAELAAAWEAAPDDGGARSAVETLAAGARKLFLTGDGKLRVFTKGGGAKFKQPFHELVAAHVRSAVAALLDLDRQELLADNVALLRLGLRLLDLVDELKRRDRVIDFQDLEALASRLLSDPAHALALQYRLDAAIQHILVDEFQDTNINQWELLRPFLEEFRSGGGERTRTVFLVGDVKQSIYGFRGAQPRLFPEVAAYMEAYGCHLLKLPTNFRSLRAIVEGVGALFSAPPLAGRLEPGEQEGVRQLVARDDQPGTFIIHAPVPDPLGADEATAGGGEQAAARAAAALVKRLRDDQEPVQDPETKRRRPLQWRDVLVLARTRTDFALYEHAFRDAGIPFVPPGRGMLAASREVQDILALLRWLAWADDDVALATVLRSPIVRLDQAAFQTLLSARGVLEQRENGRWRTPRGLWWALRESADEQAMAACAQLTGWRSKLDFEPCHALLRRIIGDTDLLHRYQTALGEQARFNLERLYDLALGSDVQSTPTARRLAEVIARAADRGTQEEAAVPSDGEGRVRFLTVHGAKGLEAPVVLLVDADRSAGRASARVCLAPNDPGSPLLLKTSAGQRGGITFPAGIEPLTDPLAVAVADAQKRGDAERAHLLYVALTRARDRLHVIGGEHRPNAREDHESPLRDLRAAAAGAVPACALVETPAPAEDGLMALGAEVAGATGRAHHEPLPSPQAWSPPARRARFEIVTPSAAADDGAGPGGGDHAEARPGRTDTVALPSGLTPAAHGDLVHRLLQAACGAGAMPPGSGPAHEEAARVFTAPGLGWVFGAPEGGAAWSEAPVIARRAESARPGRIAAVEQRITGVVDRLVVRPGRVDIIDYKTNRGAADPARRAWLSEHYRPQLAAYREVVAALYPDREVRAWLLFTDPLLADDERLHEVG
jgi:ATP-dependent helicase/nuclease subunit A